ncbi:uncharacterized protein DSM5745_07287 [Aspergillus mulundensis]|uniref:Aminoglycoside phosphotransferase domain-containing protein n=1 Tax=Aspergillus mulundensis TaxID=1810919 RepID=A0A3D8RKQ3_9EURO|nr:hypothetical protein DSM5745_07287 [Aspergillus mulundensis]RDW74625.1 hypothetical protein DSM5745_07287 [Aspergillus mulundensis]
MPLNDDRRQPERAKDAEQKALAKVNALVMSDLVSMTTTYPSMDMTALLEHKLKTYPTLRKVFRDAALKSLESAPSDSQTPSSPADVREEYRIPPDAKVIRPLKKAVLQDSPMETPYVNDKIEEKDLSTVLEQLNESIASSEIIWQLGSTAVLGLTSQLVLKTGHGIDIDHISTTDYIKQQAPRLPIPEIHGILQTADGNRTFTLMSRVAGKPLDACWPSLDTEAKASVREQLDVIFTDLRAIRPPPSPHDPRGVLLFGGGNLESRRCKDVRRQVRIADGPIANEAEFNAFITQSPARTESSYIALARSYLTADHKVVMTHGDLHPRNIMVDFEYGPVGSDSGSEAEADSETGSATVTSRTQRPNVVVTGVIDWEMCGWYPGYWEYVKALNTISVGCGFEDWVAYLPGCIGVWPREHAVDLMLSRWHG